MNPEEIWRHANDRIQARVNKQIHDTWFKPLAVDSVEGKVVSLTAPNRFFCEWIKEHYYEILLEELGEVLQINGLRVNLFVKNETRTPVCTGSNEKAV